MPEISVLCGLGNPGKDYRGTRHNLGKEIVDILAARYHLKWSRCGNVYYKATLPVEDRAITLLRPLVFINLSGVIFRDFEQTDPSEVLVVADDMSIPLGRIRIRKSGGSGGHRGLESIISTLGTDHFPRLRVGIGMPNDSKDWMEYVLSPFAEEELDLAGRMRDIAADAIEYAVKEGLTSAMQNYNSKYFEDA
jgi:PTH1 family peptidyl-tRNA hydrolase